MQSAQGQCEVGGGQQDQADGASHGCVQCEFALQLVAIVVGIAVDNLFIAII